MKVHHNTEGLYSLKPMVTTGIFDGVHLGHQRLLGELVRMASESKAPSLVITFWPHPRLHFHPEDPDFRLMMSLDEKVQKLSEMNIDHLLVLPFTDEFASWTARDFVKNLLVDVLQVRHLIVGDDHRFGKNREGGYEALQTLSGEFGFGISRLDTLTAGSARVSSTFIRSCLQAGDLESANKLLGYRYFMFGRVQKGHQIGSKIGFPTANIGCCEGHKQIPQDGVYVVQVKWNGSSYGGMLNIGTRPTVEQSDRKTIEVHLFGHSGELYGELLQVYFIRKIREEMRFNSLDELKSQLVLDQHLALRILEEESKNSRNH